MPVKKMKSIKGTSLRVTLLDECGRPFLDDECSFLVTKGWIRVNWSLEIEGGEEFTVKNANGDFCIAEKDQDRIKWVNSTIDLCEIDPQILVLMAGANAVTPSGDATTVIGATFGSSPNPNSYGIEVWTKMAGTDTCAGGQPEYGYFLLPNVRNGKLDGDITMENAPLQLSLAGEGITAPAWGLGPHGDNPLRNTFPATDTFGWVRTTVPPPDATDGCVPFEPPDDGRDSAAPTESFVDYFITASDAPNAAKLADRGFIAAPLTNWTTGQKININTTLFFNWNGTAWVAGTHA